MNDNKIWYLQQIDLFKGIPDADIMKIAEKLVEKHCGKKELLYTPFEKSDSICLLKKGEVTLYHSHYGKKLIIDVLRPGAIFGDMASDHFAEVTEDAYICFFTPEDFMKVIQTKPDVMVRFFKAISQRLADYEQRIKNGLYDAKEKIIHALGKLTGRKTRITHEKLAAYTGLSRETVTRAIGALKKEGTIVSNEDGTITTSSTR